MIGSIIRNSSSSFMVPVVKMGIAFFMTPIIIHALGKYDYGVWEIVLSAVGYMGLLDLGLQPAVTRYVAGYYATNDRDRLEEVYSSAIILLACMGVVAFAVLAGIALLQPSFIFKDRHLEPRHEWLLFVIAVQMLFNFPGSVLTAFHHGLQRYYLVNTITIGLSFIGFGVVSLLLLRGGGLLTLAMGNAVGEFVKLSILGALLRTERNGGYRFQRSRISQATLKKLFSFSMRSMAQMLAMRISLFTSPMIIGAQLGASSVALFAVPANLVNQARALIWSMTSVFMPVFSQLDALGDRDRMRSIYLLSSRYTAAIALLISVEICFLGPGFIGRWVGKEYSSEGRWVVILLTGALLVPLLNPYSTRLLQGVGKHGFLAKIQAVSALMTLGLGVVLVSRMGMEGVAFAALLPALALDPFVLGRCCYELGQSTGDYVRSVLVPLMVPTVVQVLVLWQMTTVIAADTYWEILLLGLLSAAAYLVTFMCLGTSRREREHITRMAAGIWQTSWPRG